MMTKDQLVVSVVDQLVEGTAYTKDSHLYKRLVNDMKKLNKHTLSTIGLLLQSWTKDKK